MPTLEATHSICGTNVTADVPEGYDLEEGVTLVCPNCQHVWWHYPPARSASAGGTGAPAVSPGPSPADRKGPVRMAFWLGPALVLCGVAVVVLLASDLGDDADDAPASTSSEPVQTVPDQNAAARQRSAAARRAAIERQADARQIVARRQIAARRRAAAQRRAAVERQADARQKLARRQAAARRAAARRTGLTTVRGPGFSLRRPAAWTAARGGGATVVAPSRTSPVSVAVRVQPQPKRTPDLGPLARRRLAILAPGAAVGKPASVRVSGRTGVRVSARRGTALRELVLVPAGDRRFELLVSGTTSTGRNDLATLARIVRSFRID